MARGRDSRGRVGSEFRDSATRGFDAFGPAGARTSGVIDSTGGIEAFAPAGVRTSGVVGGAGLPVLSSGGGSTQTEPPCANTAGWGTPVPSSITVRIPTRLHWRPRGRR
jgi:hypothetical protein